MRGVKGVSFIKFSISLLVTALLLGGCASTEPAQRAPEGSQSRPSRWCTVESYEIQNGDHLCVRVFGYPELRQCQLVRPDGKITLDLIGDIQAFGLTPAELDANLTEAYRSMIVHPELTVIMHSFGGYKVFVGGMVRMEREIPINGRLTALQALTIAGGSTEEGKLGSVLLVRSYGLEEGQVLELDLSRAAKTGDGDIVLQPFDIVFVPRTTIAKVDKFVQHYINYIIPESFQAALRITYDLNPGGEEDVFKILP